MRLFKRFFLLKLLLLVSGGSLLSQPIITNEPITQTALWGSSATFSVSVTGAGPFTYQWQLNGSNLPNNIITTVAGCGKTIPIAADGSIATNAAIYTALDVAFDAAGTLYIGESANNRILKVDSNGILTCVAGNGIGGYAGDGGAATNAQLYFPGRLVFDVVGNLYIVESVNNRVRKVSADGIITTFAGNGNSTFVGDGGLATNAGLNNPLGIAFDSSGNGYISDRFNFRIRKVDTNGIISTIAGNGVGTFGGDGGAATNASFFTPGGVAFDSTGNLFVADSGNNRIRKIDTNGIVTTVAGNGTAGYGGDGGAATNASLRDPVALCVDATGSIFVADKLNNRIRRVDTNGVITTVAGNGIGAYGGDGGIATNASLREPQGLAFDPAGRLYIADGGNHRVRVLNIDGVITTAAGIGLYASLGDGGQATNAYLRNPQGVAFDATGNLFIADDNHNIVRRVDTNGVMTTVAGNGDGNYSGDGGEALNASLFWPNNLAFDSSGSLFIADLQNQRVRKVSVDGTISTVAGNGSAGFLGDGGAATNARLNLPVSVALDGSNNLYIADLSNNRVRKVDTNGIIRTVAGGGFGPYTNGAKATNISLGLQGVTLDALGNLYISDGGSRVHMVRPNGVITNLAGKSSGSGFAGDGGAATNALLKQPWGTAVSANGDVYIADLGNQRIRKVGTNGVISTVAGNGIGAYAGDGGVATNASLNKPACIALDPMGNLFIADWLNNRIRKIHYSGMPTLTLPNVNAANAGNYAVIVTGPSGSVTSSVVALNVHLPPITASLISTNGLCAFTWDSVSNATYQLQYTTNLAAPDWIDLGSPITATNNFVVASDFVGPDSQRFYRVRLWP